MVTLRGVRSGRCAHRGPSAAVQHVPGAARWRNNCASGVRLARRLQLTRRPEQLIVCASGHGEHDRTVVEGGRALHQVADVWRREGKDLEISTLSQSGLGTFVQSFICCTLKLLHICWLVHGSICMLLTPRCSLIHGAHFPTAESLLDSSFPAAHAHAMPRSRWSMS